MILLISPVREYSTVCISAGPSLGLRNISELELSTRSGFPLVEEDPSASCCSVLLPSLSTRTTADGLRWRPDWQTGCCAAESVDSEEEEATSPLTSPTNCDGAVFAPYVARTAPIVRLLLFPFPRWNRESAISLLRQTSGVGHSV